MAREFSVVVGINATKAIAGGRQFKAGADQVNRSNRSMQRSTATTTKRLTSMITVMGRFRGVASLMFAGFLGVGGISAVVRTISGFETAMSRVNALLGERGTTGVMSALTAKARELGATTLFTAQQAAEGMKFLTLAGFTALETYQAIGPALLLAQVGTLELGEAADIVSNIMTAFGRSTEDTLDVVDALAFVATRTNTDIRQLGQAMKFVGPVAGALGISIEETSVALGLLGNAGLQASLAGTSLRRVMSGLLNPSREANEVLANMDLTAKELVEDLQGPDGLIVVTEKLAAAGIGAAEAFTLFGQRGAPGILALVRQVGDLREFTEAEREAGEVAQELADILADNLAGDARLAISALSEAIIQLGDAGLRQWMRDVTQGFGGFFKGLGGVTDGFDEMSESMQKGVKNGLLVRDNLELIMKVARGFIALGLVKLFTPLAKATLLWATNLKRLGAALIFANGAARKFRVAMVGIKAAIATLGPLIAVFAAVELIAYIAGMNDAEDATQSLTEKMETQSNRVVQLALAYATLEEAEQSQRQSELAKIIFDQVTEQERLRKEIDANVGAFERLGKAKQELMVVDEALANDNEESWRATNRLKRAQLELRLEITALNETLATTDSVRAREELAALDTALKRNIDTLEGMQRVRAKEFTSLEKWFEFLEKGGKKLKTFDEELAEATGLSLAQAQAFKELVEEATPVGTALNELSVKGHILATAWEAWREKGDTSVLTLENLKKAQAEYNFEVVEANKKLTPYEKHLKKLADIKKTNHQRLQDLKDGTGTVAAATRDYTRALQANAVQVAAGTMTVKEFWEWQRVLEDQLKKNVKKIEETCEKTDDLKKCMSKNAKAMQTLWDQALRNIQDAFADAFRGAFDSSSEFFDKILDAFKDMISQMLAAWAVSGIANLFTGQSFGANGNALSGIFSQGLQTLAGRAGGGTAAGGAGTGGGGGGGVLGGIFAQGGALEGVGTAMQNAFGALTSAVGAFGQGALFALQSTGGAAAAAGGATTSAVSVFNTGAQNAAIANPGSFGAGGVAAGAAIGALSGAVVDAILGSRGDPIRGMAFAAIGGVIGNAIFPVVGGLIGGAIGALVDNIFGGAKKLEKATLSMTVAGDQFIGETETIISKQKSWFRGRSYTTTIRDISSSLQGFEGLFQDFAGSLMEQAAALGGNADGFLDDFNFSASFNIRGKNDAQIKAMMTQFMNRVLLAAVGEFVTDVEGLEDHVHRTLLSFRGNVDQFLQAFQLLGAIDRLFDVDLFETSSEAIEESQKGIIVSYQESLAAYRAVIEAYDGSLASLDQLTTATAIITQTQMDLITVYQLMGQEISGLFQTSAQTVREAMLSEEELYNLRRSQIDDLVEQAGMTTDPEELSRLAEEINRLGLDAFGMLDESQIAELGPEFIEFFEGLDELFGDQIEAGIGQVVQDQADLDIEVAERQLEAAEAIIEAARQLEREARERRETRRGRTEYVP